MIFCSVSSRSVRSSDILRILAKKAVQGASLALVTLALSSAAFCGESLKAARKDKPEIVKALWNANPDLISSQDSQGLKLFPAAGTGQSGSEAAPKATPDPGPDPTAVVPTPRTADSETRINDAAALTDAQIEAAIQRGFGSSVSNITDHSYSVVLNKFNRITVTVNALSDSDRIALAASTASHDIDKRGRLSTKQNFSFSIQDARASVVRVGVVTLTMAINGEGPGMDKKLYKWLGQRAQVGTTGGLQVMLIADGKIVQPTTNAQFIDTHTVATAIATFNPRTASPDFTFIPGPKAADVVPRAVDNGPREWKASDFYPLACWAIPCTGLQFTFPVIEGVKHLTLVMISADGVRLEKELDPRRFMSR